MRRGNLFWGLVILVVGVALLLNTLGIVAIRNFWAFFWPLMLIILGLWFLLGPVFYRRELETQSLAIPLEGAGRARLKLRHGAGRLEIGALTDAGSFLSGTFAGGVEPNWRHDGDELKVKLKANPEWFFGFPPTSYRGIEWKVNLSREIPIALEIKTGASESSLDLHELKITDLAVETGASSVEITMPAAAGFTRSKIEAGVAKVIVHFPEGVAGRIQFDQGLGKINVDPQRFPLSGNFYQSPGYESAVNRVELFIEGGVGETTIL